MNRRPKWPGILLALVSLFLLVHGNRGLWKMMRLQQEKASLVRDVERLRAAVGRYRVEIETFGDDPVAVEKQAREELNLVKPGEMVYLFGPVSR